MGLVGEWDTLEAELPDGWSDAVVRVKLEDPGETDRAVALLTSVQPLRGSTGTISLRVARLGGGPGPEAIRRALGRLDGARLHGSVAIDSIAAAAPAAPGAPREPERSLAESWDDALATVPSDWSDLLGEIELDSSDYLQPGTVQLAPLNPRRQGGSLRLQFRSASSFGYGASSGMVRRCLERCDAAGMRGTVRILRVLSDTKPVGTQGPVWHIDGRMV